MEERSLLAATLVGVVYEDVNGDGNRQSEEGTGVAGVTVYLDADGDGRRDAGEASQLTAADGSYSFSVAPGTHAIRLDLAASAPTEPLLQTGPGPATGPSRLGEATRDFPVPFPRYPSSTGTAFGSVWVGGQLYMIDRGDAAAPDGGLRQLHAIDPSTGAISSSVPLTAVGRVQDVTHDGAAFWAGADSVDNVAPGKIVRFDAAGNVLASIDGPGRGARGVAWHGGTLWVLDATTYQVFRWNGAAWESKFAAPAGAFGLVSDGEALWTNGRDSGTTFRLDPGTGSVLTSFTTPFALQPSASGIAYGGGALWITQFGEHRVLRVHAGETAALTVAVVDGEAAGGQDFGVFAPATASGRVTDGNGAGLAGWQVYLDINGNGSREGWEKTTLTDAGGYYTLARLGPDPATIAVSVPRPGWSPVPSVTVPLTSGATVPLNFTSGQTGVAPVGPQFLVNATVAGVQTASRNQSVGIAADGRFAIVWEAATGIYARLFSAVGTPLSGEILVNATTAGERSQAMIAMAENGDFTVAWAERSNSTDVRRVIARAFRADGTAKAAPVTVYNKRNVNGYPLSIAVDQVGNAVVAFGIRTAGNFPTSGPYSFQRINAAGALVGKAVEVVDPGLISARMSIVMDRTGRFAAVWNDWDIQFQRYSATGAKIGGVVTAGTNALAASAAMNRQTGELVVAYEDRVNTGRWARVFSASGAPLGAAFRYADTGGGSDMVSPLGVADDGTITFAYQDGIDAPGDIFLARFTSAGVALTLEARVHTNVIGLQEWPSIAVAPNGDFVISWTGYGDGDDAGVYAQRYAAPTTALASSSLTTAALSGVADAERSGPTQAFAPTTVMKSRALPPKTTGEREEEPTATAADTSEPSTDGEVSSLDGLGPVLDELLTA